MPMNSVIAETDCWRNYLATVKADYNGIENDSNSVDLVILVNDMKIQREM